MLIFVITSLSVTFQMIAAIRAIFLIKLTGQKTAWILLSVALLIMIARRFIVLVNLLNHNLQIDNISYTNEVLGLLISLGMFGGVEAITRCFRNIKNSEQKFKDSETLYKSLTKNFPNGFVILIDKAHKIIICDGTELNKIDVIPQNLIGQKLPDNFPQSIKELIEQITDAVFDKVPVANTNIEINNQMFSISITPVYNNIYPEFIDYALLIALNVTKETEAINKLSKSEEELKRLNATKDKFFSIIAHDLRSPLSGFVNLCKLLLEDFKDMNDEERIETIRTMYESAQGLSGLLENLLEWSRTQRQAIKYLPDEYLLDNLIDYNIKLVHNSAEKKKIKIIYDAKNTTRVFCDINMINSVIRNILSNAIKFSFNNTAINVFIKENDNYCNLYIVDEGIGIPQKILKNIFQIENLSSRNGTNDERGTGLGLIIASEFMQINHGSIQIQSQENKGTTVILSIPKIFQNIINN